MRHISCNLCSKNNYKTLVLGKDRFYKIDNSVFPIVECLNCGLVYMNPQPDSLELKKFYPEDYGPYQDNYSVLKYNSFLSAIKKFVNKFYSRSPKITSSISSTDQSTDTFLDYGAGSGAYLEKMRRLHPNWNLYGLDNSDFACNAIKEKGFNVYRGDLLDVSLPNNFFNHVYMGQVIEHVHDPKKVVEKLYQILADKGTLTIATPNIDSVAFKIFKSYWFALEVPRHLYLFSPKTLSRLLRESGFEVQSIQFDREPKTAIRSLDYVLGGNSVNINPIFWHILWYLLLPVSILLSYFGKTSIMTIQAKKI